MFFNLAKFEFNYFRKQPSFYVTLLIFFLLSFVGVVAPQIQTSFSSNVNLNSPYAITWIISIMTMLGMFLVANFVGNTATRNTAYKMDGIFLSTRVDKFSYLWGRLTGAFLFSCFVFLMVPLGALIGSFWPTVDPERLGDTNYMAYVWAYIIFVIPNFIFCSALFYALAVKFRSMMGMYLGVVVFFISHEIASDLLPLNYNLVSSLLDPFGVGAFEEATRYWTVFEYNSQMVALKGNLLINRLMWLGISGLLVGFTHYFVDIRKPISQKMKKEKQDNQVAPKTITLRKPEFGPKIDWLRFMTRTRFEIQQTIKSAPFIILMIIAFFTLNLLVISAPGVFGTQDWPLTRVMVGDINRAFYMMALVVITYYAGETVWRERLSGMGDIVEATAIKNWGLYFPKIVALSLIIISLALIGVLFTTLYQVAKGYTNFEGELYFSLLSLQFVLPLIMWTILAVFVQIMSPNKYVGMLIFMVFYMVSKFAGPLGFEHNMWQFANIPTLIYSDINGYGHFITAAFWYNLYWIGFATILMILGFGLWRRGAEFGLKYRFKMLRSNIGKYGVVFSLLSLLTVTGAGGYIFYNTRILNDFVSRGDRLDHNAAFEKKYKQFESWDVPTITAVKVNVDFYPEERKVVASGTYRLVNNNAKPLTKVLVYWNGGRHRVLNYRHRRISFSVDGATIVEKNETFNTAWITFDPPLAPGSETTMSFETIRENKGFVDQNSDVRVVANGSFVDRGEILPHFGYFKTNEILDNKERAKRDLPPAERLPDLNDASRHSASYLGKEAHYIDFEATLSTVEDQIAISPGYLEKSWTDKGRRYFQYKMDVPILNYFAFQSGKFQVVHDRHEGTDIEVYHHPAHAMNIQEMIKSTKDSLDYFGKIYSPYQYRQVRIIEFPRYADFAESFANTIAYSEQMGFVADLRDPDNSKNVYYVTAHEMAHQWWEHQVAAAGVQGWSMVIETMAEYSAYMLVEENYGKDHLRKFLKLSRDRYLAGRSREVLEELPLYLVEDQAYIHYNKGGIVMYAIRDRIGTKRFHTALRKYIEKFQYANDPYPTSLDLIGFIKTEASPEDHAFIDDMLMKITLFDLKTTSAVATKLDNGQYQLDIKIEAHKYYANGQGEETEAALEDRFDIGVFAQNPDDTVSDNSILHFQKHRIVKGENKIRLIVDQLPGYVGIDPYYLMIDRNSDDNLIKVEVK